MEPKLEPVIVVDKDDNQLQISPRAAVESDTGKIIRYVYVLLYNHEGQLLLQRRHADLLRFPNYWEVSAAGAVRPEESYPDAALRLLQDELGVSLPLNHERRSVIFIPEKASRLTAVFIGKVEDIANISPNKVKVSEIRWLHPEEGLKGYLLTASCEDVLEWWRKHADDLMKT